jgi:hypothetical protein
MVDRLIIYWRFYISGEDKSIYPVNIVFFR